MQTNETKKITMSKNKKIGSLVVAAVLVFGVSATMLCIEKIPAGYNGIVYSASGGVTGETLGQGWHLVSPIKKVVEYPVSTETVYLSKDSQEGSKGNDSFFINTRDGKQVNVDAEYSYRFDSEQLAKVFTKFRGKNSHDIQDTFIRARVKQVANEVSCTYEVTDVYGEKRTELNDKIFKGLKSVLNDQGIILENFALTRIEPDEQTTKAIQQKVNERQKLDQAKIEAERAKIEAERAKIKAQGEADAKLIRAQAEAKSNEILKKSLTPELVELEKIKKWNGVNSQVVTGSNGLIGVQVGK